MKTAIAAATAGIVPGAARGDPREPVFRTHADRVRVDATRETNAVIYGP